MTASQATGEHGDYAKAVFHYAAARRKLKMKLNAFAFAGPGPKHPGYLGRKLLRAADGSYVLIMRWENEESASTWTNTLFASKAGRKLGSLVDPKSMSKEILTTVTP
jgi:heme-degrading monooxygenase HmoA